MNRNTNISYSNNTLNYRIGDILFGQVMPNRHGNDNQYRYGFNGEIKDDEIKGTGNSYDFGNRMYDPRLAKFISLDRLASKYPGQSPYVFAGNTPIWAMDGQGDSVLFYSKSGKYLGYSNDNERYKGKNLLCIIDDKNVKAFRTQYDYKRKEAEIPKARQSAGTGDAYREAIVAGLEGMGQTYNTDEIKGFIKKYTFIKGNEGSERPIKKGEEQQEWGAFLIPTSNPVVEGKNNWVKIAKSSIQTDEGLTITPVNAPQNATGWLHLHQNDSKKSYFSTNDGDYNEGHPKYINWVGQVQENGDIHYYFHINGETRGFDSNSFKEAKNTPVK